MENEQPKTAAKLCDALLRMSKARQWQKVAHVKLRRAAASEIEGDEIGANWFRYLSANAYRECAKAVKSAQAVAK